MDRVRVDVHERSESVHGVDLRERIEKSILLVNGQRAVILADAQLVVAVAVARGRRLVVLLARLKARVLEGVRHMRRRSLGRVATVDAWIGIAGVVRGLVLMVRRMLVVRVEVRWVVRLVAVAVVIVPTVGLAPPWRSMTVALAIVRAVGLALACRHEIPPSGGRLDRDAGDLGGRNFADRERAE
jgi:hypothetical protein